MAFDSQTKSKLSELYSALRSAGVTGSFTPTDNLHLTLKFLGEVSNVKIPEIKAALVGAAESINKFRLSSAQCGYFSSRGEKTVWLGMESDGLEALAKSVDLALTQLGFEAETRKFIPHVTLARRANCDAEAISSVAVPQIEQNVNCITLFESRRDGGRLLYKPLFSANLSKQ